jgi:hypothetical protein
MVELWVKDKHGEALDVIAGYDDNVSGMSVFGKPALIISTKV